MRRHLSRAALIGVALLVGIGSEQPRRAVAATQTFTTACDDLSASQPSPNTKEPPPPNVVGEPIEVALAELAKWIAENSYDYLEQKPEIPPEGVDPSRQIVIDQAVGYGPDVGLLVRVCAGTRVPDVIDRTLVDARTELAASGLVPGVDSPDAADDWTVQDQALAPGLPVPFGTEVPLTPVPPPEPRASPTPVPSAEESAPLVQAPEQPVSEEKIEPVSEEKIEPARSFSPLLPWVLLLVVIAAVAVAVAARNRLRRRWALAHITAVVGSTPPPQIETPGEHDRPAHVTRLQPHPDPGTFIVEETTP